MTEQDVLKMINILKRLVGKKVTVKIWKNGWLEKALSGEVWEKRLMRWQGGYPVEYSVYGIQANDDTFVEIFVEEE